MTDGTRAQAFQRIIWIVLDSVGIGAMPDAAEYGDEGSDTLGNIARQHKLQLPNMGRMGLGNIATLPGIPPAETPAAAYGKCRLASPGKTLQPAIGKWRELFLKIRSQRTRMAFHPK
jgi:phosphopentomutase